MSGDPLERPIWSALTTRLAPFAQGQQGVVRIDPAIGPFVAAADGTAAGLGALIGVDERAIAIEPAALAPAPGVAIERMGALDQMRLVDLPDAIDLPPGCMPLGEADAADMVALATLTEPGPFRAETWRLGGFIGVREGGGRLIAMAGERLRLPGHSEVSGICTHPDARGRGLARALTIAVMRRIAARGETAILHVWSDNAGAIALYRRLGFVRSRVLMVSVLHRIESSAA